MTFGRGVVISKFLPPHHGHRLLVDTAQARCEQLTVIACQRPTDPVPGAVRAGWLREFHPAADVMLIDDVYDPDDSAVWAANTVRWLGRAPDVVFTSEDYGDRYAGLMSAAHVPVDKARATVPCSGTAVRADPLGQWDYLDPPVRAWYAVRVCVVGAESTGTTTLAEDLARHLQTTWVPEYGRDYAAAKQSRGETVWATPEFVHIAAKQTRREDAAARGANRVLVCDTNAFATTLWHRRYVGHDDPAVHAPPAGGRCDLYLLTGDDIPFVQDGTRDGEHVRHAMHGWFAATLAAQGVPWRLVRGSRAERLRGARAENGRGVDGARRCHSEAATSPPARVARAGRTASAEYGRNFTLPSQHRKFAPPVWTDQ